MILAATGLTKSYGANHALQGVDIQVVAGQVHGLVGANGAGKSTLVKVLSGAIEPDLGSITLGDWTGSSLTPRAAHQLGLACIYQDPGLAPHLDLVANILLGQEATRFGALLATTRQRAAVGEVLARVGLSKPPETLAGQLSPAEQQLLEIAKVLFRKSRVVIMDEPTAALGEKERQQLFKVVRHLKDEGVAIIYISHHMDEVLDLCDVVTVMRGGRTVLHERAADLDVETMVTAMIGHEVAHRTTRAQTLGEIALHMRDVSQTSGLSNISLEVRAGEVLGVTGLVGAGRSRLARVLFGIERFDSGSIEVFGEAYKPRGPADAIRRGVGLVPEDRKKDALLMGLSAAKNVTLAKLPVRVRGLLNLRREGATADRWIRQLAVHPASTRSVPQSLSGGNQQKLVIARWIHADSRILILDEPTQGVDVGARDQILGAVSDLADRGAAILIISQDVEELQQIADRVVVMRRGRLVGELDREHITEADIIPLAMGAADPSKSCTEVPA